MRVVLLSLFFISGLVFVGVVMLMQPQGGLGLGMGGMANSGEYGSQKSLESSLKKIATWSAVVFVLVTLALPYVD